MVLDNPPFSIISEIIRWYAEQGIPYFLFCPGLTALSNGLTFEGNAHLVFADAQIVYENGASIPTAFKYPDHVITSAKLNNLVKYGIELTIDYGEAVEISALDEQLDCGKTIFGKGLLLSDQAAERHRDAREKAAREKAAREWTLSHRELELVASLTQRHLKEHNDTASR